MSIAGDESPAERRSGVPPADSTRVSDDVAAPAKPAPGLARTDPPDEEDARRRLERVLARARLGLIWERLWRRLAPLVALAGVFVALSWFGLWRLTNLPVRIVLLSLFAVAALGLLWRLARTPKIGHHEALSRVETASGFDHRPATAFTDTLASGNDPAGRALWRAHRRRTLSRVRRLNAGLPEPGLAARDPYALRFAVILTLLVGFVVAGPERVVRLGEAFRGAAAPATAVARIDAWVTPPAYTARPPIFLTGDIARAGGALRTVPAHSQLTIRIGDGHRLVVVTRDATGVTPIAPEAYAGATTDDLAPPLEYRIDLETDRTVAIERSGVDVLAWRFRVIADLAPTIRLQTPPDTAEGAIAMSYALGDDYGVVAAAAEITPPLGPDAAPPQPLYNPPTLPLNLPQLRTRDGIGQTTRDLSAHPWAGAVVDLTLVARDEIEQEGRSATTSVRLPARRFDQPLARAIIEQRSDLALDARDRFHVAEALDALTSASGIERAGDYLAVRSAYRRLVMARDDDGLREVVDYLWDIALGVEQGALSPLQQRLLAAQEALRKGLEEGASDEEIARLMDDLRAAMQDFLRALAEQALRNPQIGSLPRDLNGQILDTNDLDRLMDRIEDLARSGARDAARQLLSELQDMLNNLQAGRPLFGDQQRAGEMLDSLNELGDMIRQQEELLNDTFRADRGRAPQGQQDAPLTREQLEQVLAIWVSQANWDRPGQRWARPPASWARATRVPRSAHRDARSIPCARARRA